MYPDPEREQTATIDHNFAAEPDVISVPPIVSIERLRFYRWLAFIGRISG